MYFAGPPNNSIWYPPSLQSMGVEVLTRVGSSLLVDSTGWRTAVC